ncbi:hypothetical protein [Ammoniphilus sp. 3BR4]|uniref:hypothetical protein n=1 Tax=Ammoniphilus sp. 3BR4 TaxID=3158265 RepID=UPI003465719F
MERHAVPWVAMTYWGANGDQLKFRCPHAGKVDCPLGMAACSSSNYGMVVKIDVKKIYADIAAHIVTRKTLERNSAGLPIFRIPHPQVHFRTC